jgi:hypothetical protein
VALARLLGPSNFGVYGIGIAVLTGRRPSR